MLYTYKHCKVSGRLLPIINTENETDETLTSRDKTSSYWLNRKPLWRKIIISTLKLLIYIHPCSHIIVSSKIIHIYIFNPANCFFQPLASHTRNTTSAPNYTWWLLECTLLLCCLMCFILNTGCHESSTVWAIQFCKRLSTWAPLGANLCVIKNL